MQMYEPLKVRTHWKRRCGKLLDRILRPSPFRRLLEEWIEVRRDDPNRTGIREETNYRVVRARRLRCQTPQIVTGALVDLNAGIDESPEEPIFRFPWASP